MNYELILGEFFQVNNPPVFPKLQSQYEQIQKNILFNPNNQQTSQCSKDKDFKSEICKPQKQQYIKPAHVKPNLPQTCIQMKRDSFRFELNRQNLNQILSSKRNIQPTKIPVEQQQTTTPIYNQSNQLNQFTNIYDAIQEQTYGFIEAWKLKRQIEYQILYLTEQKYKNKQYTYLKLNSELLKTKLIFLNTKKKFIYGKQYQNTFFFIQNNHQYKLLELYKVKDQQENSIKTQATQFQPNQTIKTIQKEVNQKCAIKKQNSLCTICNKILKNSKGLKLHMTKSHKTNTRSKNQQSSILIAQKKDKNNI